MTDETERDKDERRSNVSRRTFVKAAGVSSIAAGLAGCLGGGSGDGTPTEGGGDTPTEGDTTTTDTTTAGEAGGTTTAGEAGGTTTAGEAGGTTSGGSQDLVDPRYDIVWGAPDTMNNLTWNPYHQLRVKTIGEPPAMYNQAAGKWKPVLAESWNYKQGEGFTVTLTDATWWNGDPVTAQDAITSWEIKEVIRGESPVVSDITKVDEKTFQFNLQSGINPNLVEETLLRWNINLRADLWQEEFERAEDISTSTSTSTSTTGPTDQLKQDIVTRKIDDPYGNWIFKAIPGSATTQYLDYEKHEGHPYADETNIPKARWRKATQVSRTEQLMISEKGDGTNAASSDKVREKYKENGISILTSGLPIGTGVAMNQQVKAFQDRRVRQAIAYATSPKQAEKIASGTASEGHIFPPTDIASPMNPTDFVSEDLLGKFTRYEQDFEKAGSLLKEAGFTGGSSGWTKPSGESFKIDILSGGPWQEIAQVVRANLKQLGIDASLRTVQDYFNKRNNPDWDISIQPWGSWSYYFHPVGAYQVDLLATIFPPQPVNQWKTFCTPREAMEDGTITVPWPPGNPDGSEKQIDLQKKIETLLTTSDEQKAKQLCEECSWVYNQAMTIRPLLARRSTYAVATDQFKVPGDDEWQTNGAFKSLLSRGLIDARTK